MNPGNENGSVLEQFFIKNQKTASKEASKNQCRKSDGGLCQKGSKIMPKCIQKRPQNEPERAKEAISNHKTTKSTTDIVVLFLLVILKMVGLDGLLTQLARRLHTPLVYRLMVVAHTH